MTPPKITRKKIGTPQYVYLNGTLYERHDREDGEIVDIDLDGDVHDMLQEHLLGSHCMSTPELIRYILSETIKKLPFGEKWKSTNYDKETGEVTVND